MGLTQAQVESAARGSASDMRAVLNHISSQLELLNGVTGISSLQPTNGALTSAATAPPSAPAIQLAGANGVCTVTLSAPAQKIPATVYYEVSYSPSQSFSSDVTTLPVATTTTFTIPAPGRTFYFRVRASFDRKTWSPYVVSPAAVDAGLQTSAATSPNVPLNQSNFAVIDSIAQGGTVYIRIYGAAGGVGTPWVNSAGKVFPSASLVGSQPGKDATVAYDGAAGMYRVKYRIADVFPDDWVIVGQVSVVTTTPPQLPTIKPIIQNGSIVGYNVTNGGSGITAPLTLTISDPSGVVPGTGATTGYQTIQGGVLLAIAPGNPGDHYGDQTTVTASGGIASVSAAGGGGTAGGNGGRVTNV